MGEEYSRLGQFLRTPFLFIKNLPGAFAESVSEVPSQVKGVIEDTAETVGGAASLIVKPLLPLLILISILGVIGLLIYSGR